MNNNKGFSLIEILIAIGLLCGLSVWMMNIFKQQTINEKTTAINLDVDATGNEIRNILGDGLSCEKTFKGVSPLKNAAVTSIVKILSDGTAQKRYAIGERKNNNTGVSVSGFDLKQDETYFVPKNNKVGETVLSITFDRRTNVYGPQAKEFKIPLSVTLDDLGNISTCHALASTTNLASICNALGRSVDTNNKKCNPPTIFMKGDIPIFNKSYIRCQGGAGSGEHVLGQWVASGAGTIRLSWSGVANDTSVTWKIYKNSDIVSSTFGSGPSTETATKDIDIKIGDVIKHTATLTGGIDNDCISNGSFTVGVDLLNMM